MKFIYRILLFFPIASVSAQVQKDSTAIVHRFSIEESINYAAKNNLQVKNALLDLRIQEQTNRGITSAALPSLTGNGSFTDYMKIPTTLLPGEFFGEPGKYIPVTFGVKYNASGGINLNQIIFDGQVFVGLQARRTSLDLQQKTIDLTAENIRANIYKIYYQLVVSKTQIDQIDANIQRAEKLLHDTKELHKNGFAEKIDADRVSVQLVNLETEKASAQNQIRNGYLGLKLLMGMPLKDSLVLTETVTDEKIKDGILFENDYKYADRNDFQALQLGKKLNEFNVKRYKMMYIPTLTFTGAYSKMAQRTNFDFFGKGDWFTTSYIGLNLNIPIFDGFQKDANIRKSKLEVQQIQNQLDNLKISIDNDVAQALNNFRNAINTMDFQKKNMQLAEEVYNQSKKKYEAGIGSNTDITNAQTDLRVAQSNYIKALYDAVIAKIDYTKAIGKL